MKLSKLLERLEYEVVQGSVETEVTTLANDSRKVESGSVFVCISGAVFDGHQYVSDVAKKGAAAIIAERDIEAPKGVTVIKAENTRYALALMSAAYFGYPAEKLKVIGITGTKGKTTTTYLIRSILEGVGHKVGLIGTIEAIIGDRKIPAANTTPESFTTSSTLHRWLKKAATVLLWKFPLRDLCFTERREFRLRSVFLRISEKIISVRMNIKTLKIINGAKQCCFNSANLALPI